MPEFSNAGTSNTSPIDPLLADYRPHTAYFDELITRAGEVRQPWQSTLSAFAHMSNDDRREAQESLLKVLRENRVTFVTDSDAGSTQRPWQIDLFPMLISPSEWQHLEASLIQRARVLNAALADLYGDQRVLHEGKLPPSIVFSNERFLRPCSKIETRDGTHLHFLAFDIARAPDGQWWILSDRTEAPSGAGYALENRVATSRVLPEMFASENVRRHASFFRSFNDYFLNLPGRDEPLAVFLSPGAGQRSYFEHSYLARYLGYAVVEGSDLAVRNDRVFLKTVDGLRPVDLMLRSVQSEMCDPLELRNDSFIGVPGLLQAARAGRVTIGNSLGSGLLESDAFMSFLPNLSRYYLGEELAIPSVATWWCGQQSEKKYVIEHLDQLIVRRISATRSVLTGEQDALVGAELSSEARAALVERIKTHGHDFIGQEAISLSTAPVWAQDNQLQPAPVMLRMFVAMTTNGYQVLPGALTRVAIDSDPRSGWLGSSDISKDTWILSDEPVETFSLLAQRQDATWLRRNTRDLPSRAADNLFWLGRYTERTEAAVRLLRSLVMRLHGDAGISQKEVSPERIVSLLVSQKHLSTRRGKRAIEAGRDAVEQELWALLFDTESRDGLTAVLNNVHRTADAVRERLSGDAFRILTDLSEVPNVHREHPRQGLGDALELLNRLVQYLAAFSGILMENMTRSAGWRFIDMGRRIERVRTTSQLTQLLTARGDTSHDGTLDLLLDLADSTMTYLGRYHSAPQLARVLDLLLVDESNPRSIAFQVHSIGQHLDALSLASRDALLSPEKRITTELLSRLRLTDVIEASETMSRFGTRILIDRLTRDAERGVDELSDHITRKYFSHSAPRRVVVGDRRREPR